MIKKIGMEVEFSTVNNRGIPVCADRYGIPHDDFKLLTEIRTVAGTVGTVYGDFLDKYRKYTQIAKHNKFKLSNQLMKIPNVKYWEYVSEFIRSGNYKDKSCKGEAGNIYGHKIHHVPIDDVIHRGGGIHLHFSLSETIPYPTIHNKEIVSYEDKEIRLPFPKSIKLDMVSKLDEVLFEKYTTEEDKKNTYRQPGFWRDKPWGFEYRSLGTNNKTMKELYSILVIAQEIFESFF